MLISFLLFGLGVYILIKGADFLIDGASSIGLRMKITPIVIGLTVVAFGTSAPELLISVLSALNGSTDLALGNIIGSNISNTLLIVGVSATIYPIVLKTNTVWKEIPMSFLAAFVVCVLGVQNLLDSGTIAQIDLASTERIGAITFTNGIILLLFFVIFMYYSFGIAKTTGGDGEEIHELPMNQSILFVLGGLVGLAFGSKLTVDNAIQLAQAFNVSESLIGLTLVALGTSLPELATSINASLKKKNDIAVGNIVGSNIFNVFLILAITALVSPIPLTGQSVFDMLVLLGGTMYLFFSLFIFKKHHLGKFEGMSLLAIYILFTIYIVIR